MVVHLRIECVLCSSVSAHEWTTHVRQKVRMELSLGFRSHCIQAVLTAENTSIWSTTSASRGHAHSVNGVYVENNICALTCWLVFPQ